MVNIPMPDMTTVAIAIIFYTAGCMTPFYYAQEQLRGFGRKIAKQLPYEPPPGEHRDDAMREAVEAGKSSDEANEEKDE